MFRYLSYIVLTFFPDFFATIKRQLTNDILMYRTASSVLHLMPISGVYSFLPKYLETQFRLPTSEAAIVSGEVLARPSAGYRLCHLTDVTVA